MGVRKCPKCGSMWYTALPKCAFCGVEGEEVKGPISPAKLNLGKRGVESGPPSGHSASDRDLASPSSAKASEDISADAKVAVAEPPEAKEAPEPAKAEAPPPEPPKEAVPEPPAPRPEPPPVRLEPPAPRPEPAPPPPRPERHAPSFAPSRENTSEGKPRPAAARMDPPPTVPAPRIPSATVPMVFGWLGLIAGVLLPLTMLVRHDKIQVTLALLAWAILAPFAPSAWFSAQRYVDECRSLGFMPAPGAQTGKVLGMLATSLIVLEFSALAIFVAFQILQGKVTCPLWK